MITTPPTHRLTSDMLIAMLDNARQRTLELTEDLPVERHLGPKLSTVNPPQWEIGHVGFFHDYFVLHKFYGLPNYQIPNAQALYDSMGVAHDKRWTLDLPSMDDTFGYLRTVRDAMVSRLPEGLTDSATSLFGSWPRFMKTCMARPLPTPAKP